jgi:hypothetical protein
MFQIKDHPFIREAERFGVPDDSDFNCPRCGYNYDCGTLYEGQIPTFKVDGEWVCYECFESWFMDLIHTNPEMVAGGLGVDFRLV